MKRVDDDILDEFHKMKPIVRISILYESLRGIPARELFYKYELTEDIGDFNVWEVYHWNIIDNINGNFISNWLHINEI